MNHKPLNVLFLCTGNSARSIMSEGLLNRLGAGRFVAFSAGGRPTGRVNPHAIAMLESVGYDTRELRSKSWSEFEGEDAPHMDIIITVCANAAGEVCPVWPGHPATAHWGYEDPHGDTEEAARASFTRIFGQIRRRIERLLSLPPEVLHSPARDAALREIGEMVVE